MDGRGMGGGYGTGMGGGGEGPKGAFAHDGEGRKRLWLGEGGEQGVRKLMGGGGVEEGTGLGLCGCGRCVRVHTKNPFKIHTFHKEKQHEDTQLFHTSSKGA